MNYNIHPLIVHFPIALLVVYSVIKILPVRKWLPRVAWGQIEMLLLVCGVLGAMAASATGETAEHLARPDRNLVETHVFFAALSTWMYGLLLATPIARALIDRVAQRIPSGITKLVQSIVSILEKPFIVGVLVVVGLIAITLTGVLGGVMVYGTTADPIAPIVLRILGL
jgi:uncharacterized membrane protein